jgi:hypothetical protein
MNKQARSTAAPDALALAMMSSLGQLSLILDHMHRTHAEGLPARDAPPPFQTLHDLVRSVLRELPADHAVGDIAIAAQMLETATARLGEELFIVDMQRLKEDLESGA